MLSMAIQPGRDQVGMLQVENTTPSSPASTALKAQRHRSGPALLRQLLVGMSPLLPGRPTSIPRAVVLALVPPGRRPHMPRPTS